MTQHSKRLLTLALILALGLSLGLGSALAQEDAQTDEEQGFFSKLWHYVEYLPVAMEDNAQASESGGNRAESADVLQPLTEDNSEMEEQKWFITVIEAIDKGNKAIGSALDHVFGFGSIVIRKR